MGANGFVTPAIGDAVAQLNMGDKVCSYGFDLGPKQQEQIKSGALDGALGQQPFLQGFWPVMQLYLQIDRGKRDGLRVDLPVFYGRRFVLPILARLQRRHPALVFEVRFQDRFADLVKDGIDLAVRAGELSDSSLVARRIDSQQLVLVASPAYLRAHGTPARVEDLAAHKAVAFRMPTSGRNRPWQLRQGRRVVELHPAHAAQISDTEALATATLLGLGLSQLPDYVVRDELARGKLVEVLPAHRPPPMPLSAVVSSGRLMPPRVRVLLDALEALRDRER